MNPRTDAPPRHSRIQPLCVLLYVSNVRAASLACGNTVAMHTGVGAAQAGPKTFQRGGTPVLGEPPMGPSRSRARLHRAEWVCSEDACDFQSCFPASAYLQCCGVLWYFFRLCTGAQPFRREAPSKRDLLSSRQQCYLHRQTWARCSCCENLTAVFMRGVCGCGCACLRPCPGVLCGRRERNALWTCAIVGDCLKPQDATKVSPVHRNKAQQQSLDSALALPWCLCFHGVSSKKPGKTMLPNRPHL